MWTLSSDLRLLVALLGWVRGGPARRPWSGEWATRSSSRFFLRRRLPLQVTVVTGEVSFLGSGAQLHDRLEVRTREETKEASRDHVGQRDADGRSRRQARNDGRVRRGHIDRRALAYDHPTPYTLDQPTSYTLDQPTTTLHPRPAYDHLTPSTTLHPTPSTTLHPRPPYTLHPRPPYTLHT